MKRAQRRELQKLAKVTTSIEFAEMLDRCEPGGKDFMYLVDMMKHYLRIMQRSVGHQPEGFAVGLQEAVQESVNETLANDVHGKDVKCGKGCSHCCHLPVHILKAEAALAVHTAREKGVQIDMDHLRRQRGHSLKNWGDLSPEDRRCVFLAADGTCSIYESRPSVCRKYNVITDPVYCDTVRFYGTYVGKLATPKAEAAVSAAMQYHAHGAMPDMLLEVLE
jgi:Fe-S-cluster containining protein